MELVIEGYNADLLLLDTEKKKQYIVKAELPNKKSDETTVVSMKARVKNKKTKRFNNVPVTDEEGEELQKFVAKLFHGDNDEEE
jgi:hypothetical protein